MSERECSFAVIASTGEKPDAELHAVGFQEEDGFAVQSSVSGGAGDLIRLVFASITNLGKKLMETGGIGAAAFFVDQISDALLEGVGSEAVTLASMMNDPKMVKKVAERLGEGLSDMLAELAETKDEEEDDE